MAIEFTGNQPAPGTPTPTSPGTPTPPGAAMAIRVETDPASWPQTPEPVAAKLQVLRRARDDARATLHAVKDEQDAARDRKRDAAARLTRIAGPKDRRWFDPPTFPPIAEDHPELVAVRRRIEVATADINRLDDLVAARSHQFHQLGRLVDRAERYFGDHLRRLTMIPLHDGPPPKLRRGEDAAAALERVRRRLRELDADRHRIVSSPWHASQAKERARAEVEQWAQRGEPHVSPMIESPTRPIGWQRPLTDQLVGGRVVTLQGDPSPMLMFWLHKDEIIKRLEAEIDAIADDEHALKLEQRTAMVAEVDRDKLAVERDEEFWFCAAVAGGAMLLRRPDADPRAVLGLRDDMPANDLG